MKVRKLHLLISLGVHVLVAVLIMYVQLKPENSVLTDSSIHMSIIYTDNLMYNGSGHGKHRGRESKNSFNQRSPNPPLRLWALALSSKAKGLRKYSNQRYDEPYLKTTQNISVNNRIHQKIDSYLHLPNHLKASNYQDITVKLKLHPGGRLKVIDKISGNEKLKGYVLKILLEALAKPFLRTSEKKDHMLILSFKFLNKGQQEIKETSPVHKNQLNFFRYFKKSLIVQANVFKSIDNKTSPGQGISIDLIGLYRSLLPSKKKKPSHLHEMKNNLLYSLKIQKEACDRQQAYGACFKAHKTLSMMGESYEASSYKERACLYGMRQACL